MTHVADIMRRTLQRQTHYISTKDLAEAMNALDPNLKMSDRKLRGIAGKPGILQACSREIFRETGFFIIRRMSDPSGVRLTNDTKELESATQQWRAFLWNLKKGSLDEYRYYRQRTDRSLGPLFDTA